MTISDLALHLQVSKSSLYKLGQQEHVPGQNVDLPERFDKVSIDEWLQTCSTSFKASTLLKDNPDIEKGLLFVVSLITLHGQIFYIAHIPACLWSLTQNKTATPQ